MRLTLTLPELERGSTLQGGPKDRQLDLAVMAKRHEPIAITPVTNHDRKVISAVLLTDALTNGKETELKFRPIWCKLFTVYRTKVQGFRAAKEKLLAVIIQTEHSQYWVDSETVHPSELTLSGNGTDPDIVHNAQYLLGDLLMWDYRSDVVLNLIQLLKDNF